MITWLLTISSSFKSQRRPNIAKNMRNMCDYGIIVIVFMLLYPIQEFPVQWGNSNFRMLYCPLNLTLVCRGCYWNKKLTYLCWFFHCPHIGFLISHKIHTKYYKKKIGAGSSSESNTDLYSCIIHSPCTYLHIRETGFEIYASYLRTWKYIQLFLLLGRTIGPN